LFAVTFRVVHSYRLILLVAAGLQDRILICALQDRLVGLEGVASLPHRLRVQGIFFVDDPADDELSPCSMEKSEKRDVLH
jgi:hypothetical protein